MGWDKYYVRFSEVYISIMSQESDEALDLLPVEELEQEGGWNFSDWTNSSPRIDVEEDNGLEVGDCDSTSTDSSERVNFTSGNEYVRRLLRSADLKLLKPGLAYAAYDSEETEQNLFHLFFSKAYLERVCSWTNPVLVNKGKKAVTLMEFTAYIGLELGMSLLKFNHLKSYWANASFLGHETFKSTMSRNRFMDIRAAVRFSALESYDAATANDDPLWFSRSVLEEFIIKSARLAVPVGISALDENTCPTKARTRAKTYSPNKPAKYGIRFYAVVGHKFCYLSSMFDNRAGNQTGVVAIHDYTRMFKNLRTPYFNSIGKDTSRDSLADTPSALWVCMMGHQSQSYKQPDQKRYFFCDNFYTRHTVADRLHAFSDKEAYLIGTVKFTNVDGTNRYYLSQAMEQMKTAARGCWCLVQAFSKDPNYERLRNQHRQQRRSGPFVPPLDNPADKAGYIVFKDSKLVLFYTNDLFENPPQPIIMGTDERAWRCVHGLAKISRWTGTEMLHRTDFLVAAPIVAYNMFMNGVDRMDQYRSTLATQRKEKRLVMTVFTFLLDLAVSQAYAIYQKVAEDKGESKKTFFEFKRQLCDSMTKPLREASLSTKGRPTRDTAATATIEGTLGSIEESHMLVQNLRRAKNPKQIQDVDCFLCRKLGYELKTVYSCTQCGKGFHVNCFTAFHYRGALSTSRQALLNVAYDSTTRPTVGKPSKFAPASIHDLELPVDRQTKYPRAPVRTKANLESNAARKEDIKRRRNRVHIGSDSSDY